MNLTKKPQLLALWLMTSTLILSIFPPISVYATNQNNHERPTYVLDFSHISISSGATVPLGIRLSSTPGVSRTINSSALHHDFDMMPLGGTLRVGGHHANRYLDANGQGRQLESIQELTGPLRIVLTAKSQDSSRTYATFNFAGQSITKFVNADRSYFSTVEFEFASGTDFLSLDWHWDALDTNNKGRLAVQRIEIFDMASSGLPTPPPSQSVPSFSMTPSYSFDFSNHTSPVTMGSSQSWSSVSASQIPGAVRTISPSATHQNFDLHFENGTFRAGGSGSAGNGFIDANGQHRTMRANETLTGPIRVVITARSSGTMNQRLYATFSISSYFGWSSNTQFISASNSEWSTATFDLIEGRSNLHLSWPWDPVGTTGQGRLAIQRIDIFEGNHHPSHISGWANRQTPPQGNNWNSITFGNGLFVAVSNQGAAGSQVMTSPDGINWTLRTTPGTNQTWSSVTFGNGLFVAVSYDGTLGSQVMTSPNGINWTLQSTPTPMQRWNSITFGDGLFVAVSSSGTEGSQVMTSPNGTNWTLRATPGANQRWRSVTFGGGQFVAVSSGGSNTNQRIMTSNNGLNWTIRTTNNTNELLWNAVAFGDGTFVAVSQSTGTSAPHVATSTDGTNWSILQLTSIPSLNLRSITFGNGVFVAVGCNGNGGVQAISSLNGRSWSQMSTPPPNRIWNSVAFGNGRFAAVAWDGSSTQMAMTLDRHSH